MKNMIRSLEKEINSEELRLESDTMATAKRTNGEFTDSQVSNPRLWKLAKLQQKIVKLDQVSLILTL
jgi:hypothetical protein